MLWTFTVYVIIEDNLTADEHKERLKSKRWVCNIYFADIEYLIQTLPENIEPEFFAYLRDLTCKDIKLSAIDEGSVVFPRYVG